MTPRQFQAIVKRFEARMRREWRHTASMMSLYANCHRDSKRQPTPFTVEDFMPKEPTPQRSMGWQEQLAIVGDIAAATGQPIEHGTVCADSG